MNENDLRKDDMNSLDNMLKETPSLSFGMPEVKLEAVEEKRDEETAESKTCDESNLPHYTSVKTSIRCCDIRKSFQPCAPVKIFKRRAFFY